MGEYEELKEEIKRLETTPTVITVGDAELISKLPHEWDELREVFNKNIELEIAKEALTIKYEAMEQQNAELLEALRSIEKAATNVCRCEEKL